MNSVQEDLQQLENLCLSDALTLDSLQKQIGRVYRSLQYGIIFTRVSSSLLHVKNGEYEFINSTNVS